MNMQDLERQLDQPKQPQDEVRDHYVGDNYQPLPWLILTKGKSGPWNYVVSIWVAA